MDPIQSIDFNLHEYKNLLDFHHRALNWSFPNQNLTQVCYGGNFAVPASRVMDLSNNPQTKHVLGLLKESLERKTDSTTSLEEHFVERTWAGLLDFPLDENQTEIVRTMAELGVGYHNDGAYGMLQSYGERVCESNIKNRWGKKILKYF